MTTLSDKAKARIRENLRKMHEERKAKAKRKPIETYYSEAPVRRFTVPEEEI